MRRGCYEPAYGPLKVRPIRVHCSERVWIAWTLPDGTVYHEEYTCPPPDVIAAVRKKEKDTDEGPATSNVAPG
jgi:hypothetical protein